MIKKIPDVYKDVAEEHDLDIRLVSSIGNHVFDHMKERFMGYEDGSVYLAHVGAFTLKSTKIEKQLRRYLSMRKYKTMKYPSFINMPPSKKALKLFNLYFKVIVPFKKYKQDLSERQVEFCKKMYESYEDTNLDT